MPTVRTTTSSGSTGRSPNDTTISCASPARVLAFRWANPVLRREAFYTDRDIQWFDPSGRTPDWLKPSQKRLACLIRGQDGPDRFLMFNADCEPATFVLPELAPAGRWKLVIDTAEPTLTERDGAERDAALVTEAHYALGSRASAILIACVSRRLTTAPSGPAG